MVWCGCIVGRGVVLALGDGRFTAMGVAQRRFRVAHVHCFFGGGLHCYVFNALRPAASSQ